ncbi:MlaD family protein [Brevundimonas sp. 2R-24]|uniref:MlaD family protein n=1 Tax=Peiella sedimenti TaxID=3061083 RepID=A0ABT8SNB0_9CAUL|nr:MlaD family protein [Caulobacteraceae bacterium XZ-24]
MERNAHYAAVGLTTVILLVAAAIFVVWLSAFQFNEDYDLYDIVFQGPVRGLNEGAEVQFNGIKVGEVTDLSLDPETGAQVIARVRLDSTTPVKVDSRAQLEPQGITGLNYIQITSGQSNVLLKSRYPGDTVPVIQSQSSAITELLAGSGTLLAQAVDALNRVNRVLSDDNIRSFSTSLNNIETVSSELAARREMFAEAEAALREATATLQEFRQLAASTRGLVEGDGAQAVQRISEAAGQVEGAAADVRQMTARLNGPVGDFASTGLPQLTAAISSLQEATEALNRLIEDVQASPQGLISRPPGQEREVEP